MKRKKIVLIALLIALCIVVLCSPVMLWTGINTFSARVRIDGFSMEPTLKEGDLLVVNKFAYLRRPPEHGDLIMYRIPWDPEQLYIDRVIGLPGDNVRIEDGDVYVNNQLIEEPYITEAPVYIGSWDIPDAALFVLGDNRNQSSDSHIYGPVPLKLVIGKVYYVYWPPERSGLVNH